MYLVTEPYDGIRVRVIAAARTPERAEAKYQTVQARRAAAGYGLFAPIRHVIGRRVHVDGELDRRVAELPTWGE